MTADCDENAAAESFFHRFKGECIDCQSFQTQAQARSVTFDDIETFSNLIPTFGVSINSGEDHMINHCQFG